MNGADPESGRPRAWGLRFVPTRIRSKLIALHTAFSLALAVLLLLILRPPIVDLVRASEERESRLALALFAASPDRAGATGVEGVSFSSGGAEELALSAQTASDAFLRPGRAVIGRAGSGAVMAVMWDPDRRAFLAASVRIGEARDAVNRLFLLLTLSLLGVYALIALTLEVFVLPRLVYEPIRTLRAADDAVQAGERGSELIPSEAIPRDEIGQIMRSRNQAIIKLRAQEQQLESALTQLEAAAGELKRKNHLLETARRNLADQDRLASLGMMSAGIAHELNTPLAVIKGCVEELASGGGRPLGPERLALMGRVVSRLEGLSESLLDFARARPRRTDTVGVRGVVEEAWTLVSLDRGAARVRFENEVPGGAAVSGDPDRLTQVFVNLLRNAVDALDAGGRVTVSAETTVRDAREWLSVTVADDGPGIAPSLFPRLFEPFASTRLDAHGTGLGLAVAEGIVREHGGLLLARNAEGGGAVFEIMLPRASPATPVLFDLGTLPREGGPAPPSGARA
ncbi:MAG TPA: hypothetical protein DEB06_09970 [Phycisphaerales bacterium]|nr:hypothetical protein [Phycisphaerales bacterium]